MARRTKQGPAAPSRRVWAAFGIALAIGAVTFLIWWATSPRSVGPASLRPSGFGAQEGPTPSTKEGPRSSAKIEIGPPRGGELKGWTVADGDVHEAIALLTQAKLVRINGSTDEIEPRLAESWTASASARGASADKSADNLTYTLKLRPGLLWSDGIAFTSADVVFSFRAVYDGQSILGIRESGFRIREWGFGIRSVSLGSLLRVGGKPLAARAIDPLTVEIRFPEPFAPGLRLLDALPILPRHKFEQALNDGTFATAWGSKTAPSEIVGLGPFVFSEYRPRAQDRLRPASANQEAAVLGTLVFSRNPRYWRRAPDGGALPYLDRIVIGIFPADATPATLKAECDWDFEVNFPESGLAADALWFNLTAGLKPSTTASGSAALRRAKPWLIEENFRRAISAAIDRRANCRAANCDPIAGPIATANASWFNPDLPSGRHDPQRARALLAELGLLDRNGDQILDDKAGRPVRFTLLFPNRPGMQEQASFIRDSLKDVGIDVRIAAVDEETLHRRWRNGDYEAIFDRIDMRDTDPAMNLDFWLSSGSRHVWNPSQAKPATDRERRIDELMVKQAATFDRVERVQLFAEVQRIFAEHMPAIYLGAPKLDLAISSRVLNASRSVIRPNLLWNAESLAVLK